MLDTAAYNPDFNYFASETSLADHSVFAAGEKAYIWIYNTQAVSTATEWLLVHGVDQNTVHWQIPAAPAGVTSFPPDFRISRVTDTLFGGFNGTQGPGEFSATPGSFTLQTHTFLSLAIPEPGTAGLLAGALAGLLRRRRGAPPPAPLSPRNPPGPGVTSP